MRSQLTTFILTMISFLIPLLCQARGGVITGGGGDLSNPAPVSQTAVESTLREYAGMFLISWFRKQEIDYKRLGDGEKEKSPFRKIFESERSMYEIIRDSSIEIRNSGPCIDADGKPWDGSVFAVAPHSICLSAWSMAPKLSFHSLKPETLALAAHEYSHILGTTEEEAQAIQNRALNDLMQINLSEAKLRKAELVLKIESVDIDGPRMNNNELFLFREFINNRLEKLDSLDLSAIKDRLEGVVSRLSTSNERLIFVDTDLYALSGPNFANFITGALYLCANDDSLRSDRRKLCAADFFRIFENKNVITYRDFSSALTFDTLCKKAPDYCFSGHEFNYEIKRPNSLADVRALFAIVDNYLRSIQAQVEELNRCGDSNSLKNCPAPALQKKRESNYEIFGPFNRGSHTARCRGALAWPRLFDVSCEFSDKEGVKADHDGTLYFEITNQSEPTPWRCSGNDLHHLYCVQSL